MICLFFFFFFFKQKTAYEITEGDWSSDVCSSDLGVMSFTGAASDVTPVTVQIHAGATAKGPVVSTATATGSGSGWMSSNASPALSSGQYSAVATQPSSLPSNP